jgi:hypothetical protein
MNKKDLGYQVLMIFILANNFNTWASVKDSDYSRKYYIAPDIGIGCPIFHANNGLLTVEFPYTTTNQAGNTSLYTPKLPFAGIDVIH